MKGEQIPAVMFAPDYPELAVASGAVRDHVVRHPQCHIGLLFLHTLPADVWGRRAPVA